jgi:ADP-ribose pyrophosphatase YjhB (NUDIX family)
MIIRPSGVWVVDGKLLTMRYSYGGRDRFNLPGGNQEPEEEIRTGLVREFQEELGVDVVAGDLLFTAETVAGGREVLHLLFNIESIAGSPQLNDQETKALELVWLSPKELFSASMYPAIGSVLAKWMVNSEKSATYLGRVFQDWIE